MSSYENPHASTTRSEAPTEAAPVQQQVKVPHRRRSLAILAGTLTVDNDESTLITTLFPTIRAALGIPLSALGIFVAVSKLTGVISGPLWMMLARRTNRKTVLIVCTGLWGVWIAATGLAQNFTQLLVLFAIAIAGFAGGVPIVNEIIGDLFGDQARGRATGMLYGIIVLEGAALAPLLGQLARVDGGWRYGFFAIGALCVLLGVLVMVFFHDPGLGATEPQLARANRNRPLPITWSQIRELLKIRTFVLMLVQRLLSGHLLIISFGVVFLVAVRGYSNAVAALAVLPFSLGYFLGTVIGGQLSDRVQRRYPKTGRVALLQLAQLAFGVVAFFGTQFDWDLFVIFAGFYAVLGLLQGVNPGINRPIVMAVTTPELRGPAFVVLLSIFQAIVWALYGLGAGYLSQIIGLEATFLWFLVVVMLGNAAFVTLIYRPYVRDSQAVQAELMRRSIASRDDAESS